VSPTVKLRVFGNENASTALIAPDADCPPLLPSAAG